jgi:hypothetical protein
MTTSRLTLLAALCAVSAVAGCGPMVTEPVPDIPQTVEYETVRIEYGDDDLLAATAQQALIGAMVGDPSFTASITKEAVRASNAIIRDHFALIDAIVALPPSRVEGNFFVWESREPRENGLNFLRFVIEQVAEDEFRYLLQGGPSEEGAQDLFAGDFTDFGRVDGEQQGTGRVFIDFDAIGAVDPAARPNAGQLVITFRAANRVRQVRTGFYRVDLGEGPLSAIYSYTQFSGGAGSFTYFARADFMGDGEPLEFVGIRSQWRGDLTGRAVARISGGSLEINEVVLRECWDRNAALTFADSSPDFADYEDGSADDCPAFLREFDDTPPVYSDPGSDEPEVPAPHPEEVAEG